tara:strand:- start:612 stop:1463 length:852 start_codon:yes stop_codon:yes gene_type:complete
MPYISIQSVLYEVGTMLDDEHWDKGKMLEWATKGFRKLSINQKYQTKVVAHAITEHTVQLPTDLRFLQQIAYRTDEAVVDELETYLAWSMGLEQETYNVDVLSYMQNPAGLIVNASAAENSTLFNTWRPMRPANSNFTLTLQCDPVTTTYDCDHTYAVTPDLVLTSTLREGFILVSYLAYPCDSEGYAMIPDHEDLKEALYHYCMFRYWSFKANIKEEGARAERDYHLGRYQILKAKASASLNMPDEGQMENIKNMTNRLVPNSSGFSSFFKGIGGPTQNTYH